MNIAVRTRPTDLAANIQISDGSTPWRPVPGWLAFFSQVGQAVALAHEGGKTVCVIVVPPVRSYAAAMAATGAVAAIAASAQALPGAKEHFESLSQLPVGTSLVVKMGEKIYSATFAGVADRGQPMLKVKYDGMTHYLPERECQRVQVGGGGRKTLPKVTRRPDRAGARAISAILGDAVASNLLSVPTVDVVLVGQIAVLSQELSELKARPAPGRGGGEAVPLASLLRADRFLADGGIPRSMLISDRVAEFEMPVSDTPHVAVFDGARAFCRYRAQFPDSSWIGILDRCAPSITEGVDVANTEFATRKASTDLLAGLELPAGTEAQAFERR